MKIISILSIALLFSAMQSSAQMPEVTWGTEVKAGTAACSYIPAGNYNGHYYSVKMEGGKGYLMDVNSKMDLVAQTELKMGVQEFDADMIIMQSGSVRIMSSEYVSGDKSRNINITSFSTDGKASAEGVKTIATLSVSKNSENTDIKYYFSGDSTIMLACMQHTMKEGEMAKISLAVVNMTTLDQIWNTTTTFPYDNADIQLLSAAVQQNGDVLLLTNAKGDQKKAAERQSTHAFIYTGTAGFYSEKTLNLGNKFISSGTIRPMKNGKIWVTGFYSELTEPGKKEGLQGPFIAIGDAYSPENMELQIKKMDSVTKASIKRSAALTRFFDPDEINAYVIREIKLNADNSGYIIAEQNFMVESEVEKTVRRTYYFNHLILFRFDQQNQITTITTIPKIQTAYITADKSGYFSGSLIHLTNKYNSCLSTEKDGKIYVLYNDHEDNGAALTLKETKTMSHKSKALATLAVIDENGKWEKRPLFKDEKIPVIMETSGACAINGSGFIMMAERSRNLQYSQLKL